MDSFGIPPRNDLPSLDHLDLAMPLLLMNFAWGTRGPEDLKLRRLAALFVSSADLALKSYRRASHELDLTICTPGPVGVEITEQFEICLIYARRALSTLQTLGAKGRLSSLDSRARRDLLSMSKGAIALRDSLMHMDERIVDGESRDGTPVLAMLTLDCKQLVAGAFSIDIEGLADLLTRLNVVARTLASLGPEQE
jgi:hypothetical protein